MQANLDNRTLNDQSKNSRHLHAAKYFHKDGVAMNNSWLGVWISDI